MGFLYRESVGIGLAACCVRFVAMKRDVAQFGSAFALGA